MTRRLEAVGYWFYPTRPNGYPRPQALVGRWSAARRAAVVAYLRAGVVFETYRGWSYCRFDCDATDRTMGHRDLFDGAWVWPEGLAHYVEQHAVRLPERFVRHALRPRRADAPPAIAPKQREGLIDETRWLAWSRARGATIELGAWTAVDFVQRQQLAAAVRKGHPLWGRRVEPILWHAASRAVCFVDRDTGELAIVGADGAVRRLAGWDEWPQR